MPRHHVFMKNHLVCRLGVPLASLFVLSFVLVSPYVSGDAATAPSGDPFIGDYDGVYKASGRADAPASGKIISEGPGLYRMAASFATEGPDHQTQQIELHGHLASPKVLFSGYSGSILWNGESAGDTLHVERSEQHYGGVFELRKVIRHSPTEGLAPPPGAVVLLPFTPGQAPSLAAMTNQDWKPLPDGSVEVVPGKGPSYTNEKFGDIEAHLEFCTPHEPFALGQARANSGVYFMNRYEVQILDSFGVLTGAGDCGAVYTVSAPRVNVSFPPGQWQTYDITFRAPRLNPDGTVREPARLTVSHNGVSIQDNVPVPTATLGGVTDSVVEQDCIQLQDHGNRMRFRNMWVVKLSPEPAGK